MTSPATGLEPDPVLAPFVRVAARELQRALDEAEEGPDLAVIVARARELDPRIPEAMQLEAGALADVVPLSGPHRRGVSSDMLAAFTGPARDELERRLTGATPLPRRVAPTWRWRAVAAGALVAAAAVVVIWIGARREGFEREGDSSLMSAERTAEDREQGGRARAKGRASTAGSGRPRPSPVAPETTGAADDPSADDARSLADLDAEAQRLWAGGDVDGAARLFERIIRSGERSRVVELAYGDLMAIARQRGETARLAELRRAYVRRFPNGRFSADLAP